jgi:hypothetical protein
VVSDQEKTVPRFIGKGAGGQGLFRQPGFAHHLIYLPLPRLVPKALRMQRRTWRTAR